MEDQAAEPAGAETFYLNVAAITSVWMGEWM